MYPSASGCVPLSRPAFFWFCIIAKLLSFSLQEIYSSFSMQESVPFPLRDDAMRMILVLVFIKAFPCATVVMSRRNGPFYKIDRILFLPHRI